MLKVRSTELLDIIPIVGITLLDALVTRTIQIQPTGSIALANIIPLEEDHRQYQHLQQILHHVHLQPLEEALSLHLLTIIRQEEVHLQALHLPAIIILEAVVTVAEVLEFPDRLQVVVTVQEQEVQVHLAEDVDNLKIN